MSLEEDVNENVKPEISAEKKEENDKRLQISSSGILMLFLNDFVIIGKCEININFLIKMYSY